MWSLEMQWTELVLRALCVFIFLFLTFRVWGKKHFAELAPFDFVLLLIISEAVQNALIDTDDSLTASFISIMTLILLNVVFAKLTYYSTTAEKFLDGEPKTLIMDGQINEELRKKETITIQELYEAIRMKGVLNVEDVYLATIETNGKISIIKKEEA